MDIYLLFLQELITGLHVRKIWAIVERILRVINAFQLFLSAIVTDLDVGHTDVPGTWLMRYLVI